MTSTNVKAMVAKMFTVGFLAAAVVMIAPAKAQAQWSVGVRIGPAPYYGPAYHRPVVVAAAPAYGFYGRDFDDRRDFDRREVYVRRDRDFDRRRDFDDRRDFRDHD